MVHACTDLSQGGAPEKDAKKIEKELEQITKYFGTLCGDVPRVQADLKRFAEDLDRRSYALIRFCMADDSDYNKVFKSMVCGQLFSR